MTSRKADMTVERCPKHVWHGFASYRCGRPVKRDGLCGIHAAAKERAAQRAVESKAKWERGNERMAHARGMADALESLGFACTVTWAGEVVVLDPEKLVEKLKEVGL